jgi:hypothetical protein
VYTVALYKGGLRGVVTMRVSDTCVSLPWQAEG